MRTKVATIQDIPWDIIPDIPHCMHAIYHRKVFDCVV